MTRYGTAKVGDPITWGFLSKDETRKEVNRLRAMAGLKPLKNRKK